MYGWLSTGARTHRAGQAQLVLHSVRLHKWLVEHRRTPNAAHTYGRDAHTGCSSGLQGLQVTLAVRARKKKDFKGTDCKLTSSWFSARFSES